VERFAKSDGKLLPPRMDWAWVAEGLPGRSNKQCYGHCFWREKFSSYGGRGVAVQPLRSVPPSDGIKKRPHFSEEEDQVILAAYEQLGAPTRLETTHLACCTPPLLLHVASSLYCRRALGRDRRARPRPSARVGAQAVSQAGGQFAHEEGGGGR
jgi:hypothetical protein